MGKLYSIYAYGAEYNEIYRFQAENFDKKELEKELDKAVKLLTPGGIAEYGKGCEKYCYVPITIVQHRKGRPMVHVKTLSSGKELWKDYQFKN